jgi:arylsulfatase A-like enzyme
MRVPDQVGLIDVLPTLLDLLGLDPVEQAQGLSLAPLVRGEEAARDRLRAVLSERALYAEAWSSHRMLAGGGVDPKWRAPTYGQRTPHWKFLWTPADPQLAREARFEAYDLRADPVEEHDVSPAGGAAVDAGRLALLSYPDVLLAKAAQSAPVAVDAATMEKLRALGYVD